MSGFWRPLPISLFKMKNRLNGPQFLAAAFLVWFFLSAVLGVWAAVDPSRAARHFFILAGGAVLIGAAVWLNRRWPPGAPGLLAGSIGLAGALAAVGFLFFGDWAAALTGQLPQGNLSIFLNKSVIGGLQIVALPLAVCGWWWSRTQIFPLLEKIALAAAVLSLWGLVASFSLGEWLGAVVGLLAGGWWWWRTASSWRPTTQLRWGDHLIIVVVVLAITWSWLLLALPSLAAAVGPVLARAGSLNRIDVWRNGLSLVQDYWWTGSGLGGATMVLSSYIYLLHVPFFTQTHHVLQQMAIEQGIIGPLAYLGLCGAAVWGALREPHTRPSAERAAIAAGLAALIGLLANGAVEAGLYASGLGFVYFMPLAFLVPFARGRPADAKTMGAALLPALFIALPLLFPAGRAQLLANLGAVAQTKAELSVFEWPAVPLQDDLRRPGGVNLAPAIEYYERALTIDPNNGTANRRLGQIVLANDQLPEAEAHLTRALATGGPSQRPVGQLLGEVYARRGEPERAAALWRGIDLSNGQLDLRSWWVANRAPAAEAAAFEEAWALLEGRVEN